MDTNSNTANWIIIGAVVLVLIIGGWWLMNRDDDESMDNDDAMSGQQMDTSDTTTDNTGSTGTQASGNGYVQTANGAEPVKTDAQGESVTVNDQPAGVSVNIASMNLTRETWVAVRDDKSILGARRFAAGTEAGVVELLRGTEAGKTYTVVVYIDNGNNAFDLTGDELVEGVSTTFTATDAVNLGQ